MQTDTRHTDKGNATTGSEPLTPSDAHGILSSSRRRHALRVVIDHGAIQKSALIDEVAEREYGTPAAKLSSKERKRIQRTLHQCHLPKLEKAGVIEVDRHTITPGPNAADVQAFDHAGESYTGGMLTRVASAIRG